MKRLLPISLFWISGCSMLGGLFDSGSGDDHQTRTHVPPTATGGSGPGRGGMEGIEPQYHAGIH